MFRTDAHQWVLNIFHVSWVILTMSVYSLAVEPFDVWGFDYMGPFHWYNDVLNKRFKTPFRDGIWNHRQVSVGDRAGPYHTTQKSSGIGPPVTQAGVVCDRARHRNPIISVGMYIPHGESQKSFP